MFPYVFLALLVVIPFLAIEGFLRLMFWTLERAEKAGGKDPLMWL